MAYIEEVEEVIKVKSCYFCEDDLDVVYKTRNINIDGSIWNEDMLWPQVREHYVLVNDINFIPVIVCKNCEYKITVTYHRPNPDRDERKVLNISNRDSEHQDGWVEHWNKIVNEQAIFEKEKELEFREPIEFLAGIINDERTFHHVVRKLRSVVEKRGIEMKW